MTGATWARHAAAFVLVAGLGGAVPAQQPAPLAPGARLPTAPGVDNPHGPVANGSRRVDGKVVRLTTRGLVGAAGRWVTLHRVGTDAQGPVDSMRAGADGSYHFAYRATGSDRAIYFVAATYAGIAYFTPPLKGTVVTGAPATITVFDTTSRNVPLAVRGRHVIVNAADSADQTRTVLEVFELSNDSTRTLVGADSATPTWTTALPDGARDVQMEQGDVPADAMTVDGGRLRIYAPFAPGVKQFSFSYRMPAGAFPMTLAIASPTAGIEVLLEDPSATVRGAQLTGAGPVAVGGRTFQRFVAQDAPASGTFVIEVPAASGGARVLPIVAIVAAVAIAMLIAVAGAAMRGGGPRARAARADDPERIAREIADLDLRFERREPTDAGLRAEYEAARAALKARLMRALATRDGDA